MKKILTVILLIVSGSSQAGTLLLNCNNQDVVLFEPRDGEVYLEIPDIHFTSEYIGSKIEGKIKTMKFLGLAGRNKVELIIVKGGGITLKHFTEHKCDIVDSNVR